MNRAAFAAYSNARRRKRRASGEAVQTPPENTVLPTITGTPMSGETLTGATGTWDGEPTAFQRQWYADDVALVGQTGSSLLLTNAHVDAVITFGVTASNGAGTSAEAVSLGTDAVEAIPVPTNAELPTISGTLRTGSLLTGTNGAWTGTPSSYAYQWYADDVAIPGATALDYTLTDDEIGAVINFGVTATNGGGASTEAQSTDSAAVEQLPIGTISDLSATADGFDVTLTFTPPSLATEYEYVWDDVDPPETAGIVQPLSNLTVDLESLPDETEVFFKVRGKAGASVGAWSNVDSIQTQGAEEVTNGTFDTNITGWTASTATLAWDGGGSNGKIRITGSSGGAGFGRADQTLTGLTPGATYRLRIGTIGGTSPSPNWRVRQDSTAGAILVGGTTGSFAPVDTTFVAPASGTVVLQLLELNSLITDFVTFDNVSVRKVVP